jgi:uncharacterized protein YneR
MKYGIAFHFVSGREVRSTDEIPDNIDLSTKYDELANMIAEGKFFHFVQDDQLVSVNMSNVAYVRVYEIKECME